MTPVIIRAKSGKRQRNGEFPNRRAIHWQKATVMKSERLQERIRKDRFSNSEKRDRIPRKQKRGSIQTDQADGQRMEHWPDSDNRQ